MLKIKLYPCFNKWLEYSDIVLLSDPHFGDSDMTVLRTNNISDEEQLKRINAKCGKKTVFICLGDCGLSAIEIEISWGRYYESEEKQNLNEDHIDKLFVDAKYIDNYEFIRGMFAQILNNC